MGKKKDKLYKLEPETKAMIAAVRSAVEDCAATGLYGRFMGFEESHTTDDYRLTAVFDCGEYRLRLRYLPSVMLLTNNFLDIDLDYGDAGRFTLYDVFNVLEIEDFNQYYHSGFSTTGEVPGLGRELLEAVHKYDYDLRRAADPQLLEMAKVFRLPLARRVKAIWLPAILPAFRQGCSVALGICWKSGVAAEVIGLPDGSIGDALYRAKITLSTGELFAWTFVIILLSAGFEKLFLALLDKAVVRVLGEDVAEND